MNEFLWTWKLYGITPGSEVILTSFMPPTSLSKKFQLFIETERLNITDSLQSCGMPSN